LDGLTAIASRAAAAILAVPAPELTRREKPDRSPVTAADEAAEAGVLEGLARLLPGLPVISEEAAARATPEAMHGDFLLVDPLDGTRELLAGESEYAVNIALVRDGVPELGVIAAPALGLIWRGIAGQGAERLRLAPGADPKDASARAAIRTRKRPAGGLVAVISRFHHQAVTETYLERFPGTQRVVVGSALKFCRIAEGAADVYARMSPMSEWDIAAGHALVVAAGGAMTAPDGAPLRYGQAGVPVPCFVAAGNPALIIQ
jgi:3'(2'), 5'-bisphosphate nucleotidase